MLKKMGKSYMVLGSSNPAIKLNTLNSDILSNEVIENIYCEADIKATIQAAEKHAMELSHMIHRPLKRTDNRANRRKFLEKKR